MLLQHVGHQQLAKQGENAKERDKKRDSLTNKNQRQMTTTQVTVQQNQEKNLPTTKVAAARQQFELACKEAQGLQIVSNFGAAFQAVNVVSLLTQALPDEVMDAVFMPLMNKKIGFLTDRTGQSNKGIAKPLYSRDVVRDCVIDAVTIGLLPTGNQFNIIAGRMYPTKEGYTALLRKLGVKYLTEVGYDKGNDQKIAEIPYKMPYSYNGEKSCLSGIALVKKDDYSSPDQLRGKAERRAKKALYEYLTGCDFGEADEDSGSTGRPTVREMIAAQALAAAKTQAEGGLSDDRG